MVIVRNNDRYDKQYIIVQQTLYRQKLILIKNH